MSELLQLDHSELERLRDFVEQLREIDDADLRELAELGADGSLLACFEGFHLIPRNNVLCVVALMLGLDIWHAVSEEPAYGYLATRIRRRINELQKKSSPYTESEDQ